MSGPNRLPGIAFDKILYLDYAQVCCPPCNAGGGWPCMDLR